MATVKLVNFVGFAGGGLRRVATVKLVNFVGFGDSGRCRMATVKMVNFVRLSGPRMDAPSAAVVPRIPISDTASADSRR